MLLNVNKRLFGRGGKAWFVVFASFRDVNLPTMVISNHKQDITEHGVEKRCAKLALRSQ